MNKYLLLILIPIFILACSNVQPEADSNQEKNTIIPAPDYELIRDNLYSDNEGNLYLKSKTQEHFETGKWIDVWIKTVYCDTCWTPTENGWTDITELKDFVDIQSFQFDSTDNQRGGDFYEDKNYRYFHKWMADGGTLQLLDK